MKKSVIDNFSEILASDHSNKVQKAFSYIGEAISDMRNDTERDVYMAYLIEKHTPEHHVKIYHMIADANYENTHIEREKKFGNDSLMKFARRMEEFQPDSEHYVGRVYANAVLHDADNRKEAAEGLLRFARNSSEEGYEKLTDILDRPKLKPEVEKLVGKKLLEAADHFQLNGMDDEAIKYYGRLVNPKNSFGADDEGQKIKGTAWSRLMVLGDNNKDIAFSSDATDDVKEMAATRASKAYTLATIIYPGEKNITHGLMELADGFPKIVLDEIDIGPKAYEKIGRGRIALQIADDLKDREPALVLDKLSDLGYLEMARTDYPDRAVGIAIHIGDANKTSDPLLATNAYAHALKEITDRRSLVIKLGFRQDEPVIAGKTNEELENKIEQGLAEIISNVARKIPNNAGSKIILDEILSLQLSKKIGH